MTSWKPIAGDPFGGRWVGHDPSSRFGVYTRGNAGEVYPEVFTPLSFTLTGHIAERAMRATMIESGLVTAAELDGLPMTTGIGGGVYGGYAYLNLSIQRMMAGRLPGAEATDADRNYLGSGAEPPPYEPVEGERNLRATIAGTRRLIASVRTKQLPQLEVDRARVVRFLAALPDPAEASDDELRRCLVDHIDFLGELFEHHLSVSWAAGTTAALLSGICTDRLHDPQLVVRLLGGIGDIDSAAPSQAMWELGRLASASPVVAAVLDAGTDEYVLDRLRAAADAESADDGRAAAFLVGFERFLDEHGARGPNEWDSAFDTWGTDPRLALVLIDRMRGADDDHEPARRQAALAADAAAATTAAVERLRWPLDRIFAATLASVKLHSRGRERAKTTIVTAIHGLRLRARELDRRLVARADGTAGDLWFITADELADYVDDPAAFADRIAERRGTHGRLAERVPPFFFSGRLPPLDQWELRSAGREPLVAGDVIEGIPGSPGVATGRARIVTTPGDPGGLEPGDILVAPITDPAWTPLFVPADAVVVDVGALLSHAVIVSRELGIPCIVSATDATKRIPDGALIRVDGGAGTVTVIDEPPS